jgi:hypothetical protein
LATDSRPTADDPLAPNERQRSTVGETVADAAQRWAGILFAQHLDEFEILAENAGLSERREMVLCLEVLIHQSTREEYDRLVGFLAEHTERTLLVSGYGRKDKPHHMLHFYEPLSVSLTKTGRFQSIRPIGRRTDVTVFRCDVDGAT